MAASDAERILEKLAKDVESAVHALYRGEVRQNTAQTRTMSILNEAKSALMSTLASEGVRSPTPMPSPRPSVAAPAIAGAALGWSKEEGESVLKCITAWLPMGPPNSTAPDTKCVSAMRDLTPTWGQREKAREAVRRISQP
jgi:hypothetical protein